MEVGHSSSVLPAPLPPYSAMWRDLNVLLVDRDLHHLQHLKSMLQLCGYNSVAFRQTAEEALGWIRRNPIDILICEIGLPNMEGLQLMEVVRNEFKDLQVILLSNPVADHELGGKIMTAGLELGASAFYFKPVPLMALKHMWQKTLARKIRSRNQNAPIIPPQLPISTDFRPQVCSSYSSSSSAEVNNGGTRSIIRKKSLEARKLRIRWTEDLERKFDAAVDEIRRTADYLTAGKILSLMKRMGVEDLCLSQVSSHLQHYKKKKRNKKRSSSCAGDEEEMMNTMTISPLPSTNPNSADSNGSSCCDNGVQLHSNSGWTLASMEDFLLNS